jgi:UDP-N-acetylmuramoyl-tripeptide--D-alanyl-D-alanine ligase
MTWRSRVEHAAERSSAVLLSALAFVWRRLLFRTTVIAITGSVGKTTAKECLAAVLSRYHPTVKTTANRGARWNLPRTLLRARPRHRFVVAEVGIDQPGYMWRSAWLLRPDIVVMINVKGTHSTAFPTLKVMASEKAKLLRPLRRRGIAVLNADDPNVEAMGSGARFQVCTFGTSPACDIWGREARSSWPGRLSLQAHTRSETVRLETRLVGTHWVSSVLAVLAVATRCGLTLEQAAQPLRDVEPFPARMQPVELPSGATILRDEYNGSLESLGPALAVLEEAQAARRWLVVSDFADARANYRHRMRHLAEAAVRCAEMCIFLGEKSAYAKRRAIEAGFEPGNVFDFLLPEQAAGFLKRELRSGDLVLLRGLARDHLSRIVFAQLGTVDCWKLNCTKRGICDTCSELGFQPQNTQAKAAGVTAG